MVGNPEEVAKKITSASVTVAPNLRLRVAVAVACWISFDCNSCVVMHGSVRVRAGLFINLSATIELKWDKMYNQTRFYMPEITCSNRP